MPEDVKKAVAVRVLKDKIDGERFAELLADGKWDDLDIEDDRAAQVRFGAVGSSLPKDWKPKKGYCQGACDSLPIPRVSLIKRHF